MEFFQILYLLKLCVLSNNNKTPAGVYFVLVLLCKLESANSDIQINKYI